ncbi:hypothetical protein AYO44_17920 [Planctomycetaceae bacterium SCGC AG-212-F19]|nr:hypothetical protein AYO44_17920 [Planctomycetaceae bacterium SCGC AG-212-F19]
MSSADDVSTAPGAWPPIPPWQRRAVAGGAICAAAAFSLLSWDFPLVIGMLTALLAIGGAVVLQPRSPRILCEGAVIALVCAVLMRPSWNLGWLWGPRPLVPIPDPNAWDSARIVVLVLAGVALFAAAMVALPAALARVYVYFADSDDKKKVEERREAGVTVGRQLSRFIMSVFVLVHFTGISCAFLSVPPPTRDSSWLAQWGWTLLQPYLHFMYLVNAYRFYSPEPGAAPLLWYYVEYEDGTVRELRIPTREDHAGDPLGQEYTRRLSLASSVDQVMPFAGVSDEKKHRRLTRGDPKFNEDLEGQAIPVLPPPLGLDMQYREPRDSAKKLLADYAKHIALAYPTSEKDPSKGVVAVKIYCVTHRMLDPWEIASGKDGRPDNKPTDLWTYMPFYQGEYVKPPPPPPGEEAFADQSWVLKDPNDPFLYWLIPIFTEEQPIINPQNPAAPPLGTTAVLRDSLKIHAYLKTKPRGVQP